MLTVVELSAEAGGDVTEIGQKAFEAFLAAADRINEIPKVPLTGERTDYGVHEAGEKTEERWRLLHTGALRHLRKAVEHLESFAERRDHEPGLPKTTD
jgi:hypothetical protein